MKAQTYTYDETVATYSYWLQEHKRKQWKKRKQIATYILKASGKLLYFLACFFVITLPITMFIAWVLYAENILAVVFAISIVVILAHEKGGQNEHISNDAQKRTKHNRRYA